ncbi:hypothetical protein FDP22_20920 (plasmid) [Paroceanicella profunda]|uniref:Uncharacterized protein n=1 Tax=Paroceanicella profunda TaxID=2579971 RepID=A0A5B8G4H5_9RHOB|nr:hypothetical protein [Paroceanicella profunda]QDL94339.1 hypothetical protein FDP22_20920 [Paroceanicella profunda]
MRLISAGSAVLAGFTLAFPSIALADSCTPGGKPVTVVSVRGGAPATLVNKTGYTLPSGKICIDGAEYTRGQVTAKPANPEVVTQTCPAKLATDGRSSPGNTRALGNC